MSTLFPWLRIVLGVLIYIAFALGASVAIRKAGQDVKEMQGRSSLMILNIGSITNLCVLVVILLLVRFLDRQPLGALGLGFNARQIAFSIVAVIAICLLALAFVMVLKWMGKIQFRARSPVTGAAGMKGMFAGWIMLLAVALQEEALFRGYLTLNLRGYGAVVILTVTTLVFAGIHVLTNRVSLTQFIGWLIGGAVLGYAYLLTGSIWVAIVLHFVTDMINVLVFDILGEHSVVAITPVLTANHRAVYRIGYALVLVAALLVFFGPTLAIS